MHVPHSWCFNVCKGNWQGNVNSTPPAEPYKEISTFEYAINFLRTIKRVATGNFELHLNDQELTERGVCCTTCHAKNGKCPYCGCNLYAKKRIEKGCPNKDDFLKLKKYPPRNFWQVAREKTSVIMVARNESTIDQTIESLRENATGLIEIVVVLDGCDSTVNDADIVIKTESPVGKKAGANLGAKRASGEYLFHIDAHCTMDYGWDTKLKCAADDMTIAISCIQDMDKDTWQPKGGRYTFVKLDENLNEKWAKFEPKTSDVIEESETFTGCGWMIKTSDYWQLGGFDESLGEYGHDGPEWSIKIRAAGGRVVLRKDVTCGHVFGTNTGGRLYRAKMATQQSFKRIMIERYRGYLNSKSESARRKMPAQ